MTHDGRRFSGESVVWVLLLTALSLLGCGGEGSTASEAPTGGSFSVVITDVGDQKIQAIKTVREVTGLGLRDAKDLVDRVPSVIKDNLSAGDAQSLAEMLRSAGATVEIRPR